MYSVIYLHCRMRWQWLGTGKLRILLLFLSHPTPTVISYIATYLLGQENRSPLRSVCNLQNTELNTEVSTVNGKEMSSDLMEIMVYQRRWKTRQVIARMCSESYDIIPPLPCKFKILNKALFLCIVEHM